MSPPGSTLDEEPFVVDSPARNKEVEVEKSEGGVDDDDDDDGSDGDDEEVSDKKKFEEIMRDLKDEKLDLRDSAKLEQFAAHNASYLRQKTVDGDTLLHLIVEDARSGVIERYQPLVKLLIDSHPHLLGEKNHNERTPLCLAISKKREKLVRFMCDTHPKIDAILSIPWYRSENCLHIAMGRNITPELAVFLIEHASEGTLCAKDDKGNTPLHLAVDYQRCTDVQLDIVKALILRCDKALDERTNAPNSFSPYRYHEHTHAEAKKAAKEKEKEAAQGKKGKGSAAGGDGWGWTDGAGAKFQGAPQAKDAKAPKHVTDPKGQGGQFLAQELGKPMRRVSISSEAPLGRYGGASGGSGGAGNGGWKRSGEPPKLGLYIPTRRSGEGSSDGKGLNPKTTVASEESRRKKREKEEVKVTEESAAEIRNYLKLHCMRTRNQEDVVDFLYGRNPGMYVPSQVVPSTYSSCTDRY